MLKSGQKYRQIHTGKRATIWLALLIALGMHAMFLNLPFSLQTGQTPKAGKLLELHLGRLLEPQSSKDTHTAEETPWEPERELPSEPETAKSTQDIVPGKVADTTLPAKQTEPFTPYTRTSFDKMTEIEKMIVTSSILSQQFIRKKPEIEQLFGRPLKDKKPGPIAEFHYPERVNMIRMLDKPMPDLPFAYQENLIHFAYDPGVRGDLQQFWDVITPEFGWRTRYGTEVRCVWVLVIAACGWK